MRDKIGRFWVIFLVLFIIALSLWLWGVGRRGSPQAEETYLTYEAARLLGCTPYVLSREVSIDLNEDGVREYLISCDSSLSSEQSQFAILQVQKKKIQVFMHFREGVWLVGEGPSVRRGYWLIDRRQKGLMFADEGGMYFRPIWKRKQGHIQLVGE